MIRRQAERLLRSRLKDFPAVALAGPRQCGKTTLARSLGGEYFDLERPEDQTRLNANWDAYIAGRRMLILDEAQSMPVIFSRLRGAIDDDRRRNGRFLLLGSVSPLLLTHVSESLAGRLGRVELTPFVASEIGTRPMDRLWFNGGFPDGGILRSRQFGDWQNEYLAGLVERDLPRWGVPATGQTMRRLMLMLAAVHGQVWNASQISQSIAVSAPTVNTYVDYLAGCFLVRRLLPWHSNFGKRLIKSPKLFWRDSGLLHVLLGLRTGDDLFAKPWVGASWEGFVIEQIIAALHNAGRRFEPYYLRTSDQYEVDLLLEIEGRLWAIEIKLSSDPAPQDLQRLNKIADMVGADLRILLSRSKASVSSGKQVVCDLPWLLRHLGSI